MSNSSTSLVQYPLPYKAVDGCLFVEKANKNGTTTKKLCNLSCGSIAKFYLT